MKIGVLKETKTPPDRRVSITPQVAKEILSTYNNCSIVVEPSDIRAYKDNEYSDIQIPLSADLQDCDLLMGIKEVALPHLLPNKKYMFFSHTGKKQPYNRPLLQKCAELNITLIDYEYLTDEHHIRLIAFGHWAGIVGAYNGILTYGLKSGLFNLKRASHCFDLNELLSELDKIKLPPVKILLTGGGRVAGGAMKTIKHLHIKEVTPEEYLSKTFDEAVFCRLDPWYYAKHKENKEFVLEHFFQHPDEYESTFIPYALKTDIYISCHFWDPRSPVFLNSEDYLRPEFHIQVIADISCDIRKPIASTIRPSTIADPIYGYNPKSQSEDDFHKNDVVAVMAVDNLPAELARNSSEDFSHIFLNRVLPEFLNGDKNGIIERATILKNGKLTPHFDYLTNYLAGKE